MDDIRMKLVAYLKKHEIVVPTLAQRMNGMGIAIDIKALRRFCEGEASSAAVVSACQSFVERI